MDEKLKTILVVGLIGLVLLVMVLTLVGVHFNETRKIKKRLGKSQAHPDSAALMDHIDEQQERTRAHISAQLDTKDHDGKTAQAVSYEILGKLNALIATITEFIKRIGK